MSSHRVVLVDRSERGKLSFTGPQRGWFLHQVVTQAFEDISPGEARDAAMITAHGRMTAYFEALATEDSILCHFEPELRPTLPAEIGRYVFVTQVAITDVTDDYGLVLLAGQDWRDLAAGAGAAAVVHPTSALGTPAGYLWAARPELDLLVSSLQEAGAEAATEDDLEGIRIANGVPRWGREMNPKTFPQEAGIDDLAVHYDKGCYLGQEAMAKIHFRGKVNRALYRLESEVGLEPGAEVRLDGQKVGVVTSARGGRALGLLRYTVEPGAEVSAGRVEARVTGKGPREPAAVRS